MRIGIEINGVLRNTIGKIEQTYSKFYIENNFDSSELPKFNLDYSGNTELLESVEPFEYGMELPVTSLNLRNHFKFQTDDELYSFLFEEYTMEIFGHASSSEFTSFNDLNEIYHNLREKFDLIIVSDEIGKSKPATLFFLSKFGCLIEKIKFYSNSTINSMWNEIDILLTSNPNLLLNYPSDKIVVKFETDYNKEIETYYKINSLKQFEETINKIRPC